MPNGRRSVPVRKVIASASRLVQVEAKKKIYHFNGVQNNREAIDVQPWNAASRLKTGFCRVYVYWPVFGFNQTRS